MMPARPVITLLLALILSGCFTDPKLPASGVEIRWEAEAAKEIEPLRASFQVVSLAGPLLDVAALAWLPNGTDATSTVLLVHGSAGVKEKFGALPVPGYSVGSALAATGRAAFAIDRPWYGETGGNGLVGMDMGEQAFVAKQVADQLRSGAYTMDGGAKAYDDVVGLGQSHGSLVVQLAQGLYAAFDGIVAASWPHGGFSPEYVRCDPQPGEAGCPTAENFTFWTSASDPVVVAAIAALGEPVPPHDEALVWANCGQMADPTLDCVARLDDVTRTITGPVLVLLGERDFYYRTDRFAEEGDSFPNAVVQVEVIPETGHSVFHHTNRNEVNGLATNWLAINNW